MNVKAILPMAIISLMMSSCVTLGKYQALEATNQQMKKEHNVTRQELAEMRAENTELLRQNQALTAEAKENEATLSEQTAELARLRNEIGNLRLGYDTIIENYVQQITGQNRDLTRANDLLAARTRELNEREAAFAAQETALLAKQAEIEQAERRAQEALAAKEKELEQVRNSVTQALVGFKNKGLNVDVRDGRVYVSMESKLLFPSASWTVSREGSDAIKELAHVLEENTDLNITVEGHTDNDAYKGSSAVKDNWDLSVMRATAIVKLLLKHGSAIDPARIEAAGHGQYAPKADNSTAEGKAQNRRTEIILTPKLTDILNAVGE